VGNDFLALSFEAWSQVGFDSFQPAGHHRHNIIIKGLVWQSLYIWHPKYLVFPFPLTATRRVQEAGSKGSVIVDHGKLSKAAR